MYGSLEESRALGKYMVMELKSGPFTQIDGRKHNASHVLTGYTYTRDWWGDNGTGTEEARET